MRYCCEFASVARAVQFVSHVWKDLLREPHAHRVFVACRSGHSHYAQLTNCVQATGWTLLAWCRNLTSANAFIT